METIWTFLSKYTWIIAYVSLLSLAGGVTSYIRKRKNGIIERFNLSEFIGDMVISGFVGVVTYLICKGAGLNELLTAGCIGIASHMGTRAITFIEELFPKIVDKYLKF